MRSKEWQEHVREMCKSEGCICSQSVLENAMPIKYSGLKHIYIFDSKIKQTLVHGHTFKKMLKEGCNQKWHFYL